MLLGMAEFVKKNEAPLNVFNIKWSGINLKSDCEQEWSITAPFFKCSISGCIIFASYPGYSVIRHFCVISSILDNTFPKWATLCNLVYTRHGSHLRHIAERLINAVRKIPQYTGTSCSRTHNLFFFCSTKLTSALSEYPQIGADMACLIYSCGGVQQVI